MQDELNICDDCNRVIIEYGRGWAHLETGNMTCGGRAVHAYAESTQERISRAYRQGLDDGWEEGYADRGDNDTSQPNPEGEK